MNDRDDSTEPLHRLPAAMPRRFAEYKPAVSEVSSSPPTNVGGYEELLDLFHQRGQALPRTGEGLASIDLLVDSASDKDSLEAFARPIGMFYGDVLTHSVPGAHWEVVEEGYPRVRITGTVAVDVVRVATGRLSFGTPTLTENYAHVLELVGMDG
ncbi:DUF6278 family protein [Arthrobacter sp. Soil736]|uniref:DUF6278 family protein n=1 Tax=Arthrobacter sp. Soil736 TaxID=1736395 RepID=UPI000B22C445|nr:DUF6278 family protein [Arthrobacter sp. Soil736]